MSLHDLSARGYHNSGYWPTGPATLDDWMTEDIPVNRIVHRTKAELTGNPDVAPETKPTIYDEHIPAEMKAARRWVVWSWVWRDGRNGKPGKWTKCPQQITGANASSTDPATWATFDEVARAFESGRFAGIGFVLGDGWAGVDLDEVRDPVTGAVHPDAEALVTRVGTYCEESPTGTGLKLFGRGEWTGAKNKFDIAGHTNALEIYGRGRFFTVTGERFGARGVADVGDALEELRAELEPPTEPARAQERGIVPTDNRDDELLALIHRSQKADEFRAVWDNRDGAGASEGDAALYSRLVFWVGPHPEHIERLARRSNRARPKWDEKRGDTSFLRYDIERAIARGGEYYRGTGFYGSPSPKTAPTDPTAPPKKRFQFVDSSAFAKGDYRPEWLITGALVKGQPGVIAGPSKALKTNLSIDLAVSLAAGLPFLGKWVVPKKTRVAIVSGESGPHTLQETARRVCAAKGVKFADVGENLQWCFSLPTFSDVAVMREFAHELASLGAEVVIIDPVYLALGAIDAKNMFEMGAAFRVVAEVLLAAGCTPLLVHHANRQLHVGEQMGLSHLAYAGLDQFARQFMLLNRRTNYTGDGTHELWFSIGGSIGHGGVWALSVHEGTVDEDFGGRQWIVGLRTPSEVREDAVEIREERKNTAALKKEYDDEKKVQDAIDVLVTADVPGASVRNIRDRTKLSNERAKRAIDSLVHANVIEAVRIEKTAGKGAKQTLTGYRNVRQSAILGAANTGGE